MKAKLTVTIDKELLPRARRSARARGVSLSRLIEDALRSVSEESRVSFGERWRGAFRPAARNDRRYKLLAKKYL